jgi:ABC-2 type transport system permease protein
MTGEADALRQPTRSAGRKRKRIVSSQPDQPQRPASKPAAARAARPEGVPAGWRVIAAKEFADHVTSIRFLVLTVLLSLAASAAVFQAAGQLKDVAPRASGVQSLFLYLFYFQPEGSVLPTFVFFAAFLGPLLGIAFGFDGVNGERSEGTLPRLVAQPIHRDDVINGKFVAGLAAIGIIFVAVIAIVSAIGILQLGVMPGPEEIIRLLAWIVLAIAYVGLWLALALLCSVVFRRAATSALVALGIWLVIAIFADVVVRLVTGVLAPLGNGTSAEQLANLTMRQFLTRLSPGQLFTEATQALLDPSIRTYDIGGLVQIGTDDRALPSLLSLDQSLLVAWPQFVALIALTAGMFALAYVAFMRQEVRA